MMLGRSNRAQPGRGAAASAETGSIRGRRAQCGQQAVAGSLDTSRHLIFPDIYDIGISNVGLKILYDQINQRPDALAERAYAPWTDMEALMRAHAIPLYSLEFKHEIADFDVVGFSLPYETLYTNTLNLLDLSGIPIRPSTGRKRPHRDRRRACGHESRAHARVCGCVRHR